MVIIGLEMEGKPAEENNETFVYLAMNYLQDSYKYEEMMLKDAR